MQDECRRDDARQKVEDIDVSTRLQQPGGILGEAEMRWQVIERAHLFDRGIGQQQRCQDLPEGGVVLRPSPVASG